MKSDGHHGTSTGRLHTVEHRQQETVDHHFTSSAEWWKLIYQDTDLISRIYQKRREVVLEMVHHLRLPANARILEVGCGAGFTTTALAAQGFHIDALDTVPEMINLTQQHAQEMGVGDRIAAGIGDIHSLQFADNTFDCVIAMGVLPWIHSPETAMKEMARVVKPGCCIIATADNKWRLNHLIDPRLNPLFVPAKNALVALLSVMGVRKKATHGAWVNMHSRRQINHFTALARLDRLKAVTVGFGPFSFLGKKIVPESWALRFNHMLQNFADRNVPGFRWTGSHYIILAQKESAK